MKLIYSLIGLALVSSTQFNVAKATEVTANMSLATDYVFRGMSQTDEKGAIQGGFDAGFDNGLYAGIWASNVNFGSETSTEMDYYFGYKFELSDGVELDLSYIYFDYEGDPEFDYQEVKVAISFSGWTTGFNYSDEYLGDGGESFIYPFIDYSFETDAGLGVDFHVGMSQSDDDNFVSTNDDTYIDWSIGLSSSYSGVDFSLAYYDTDIDELAIADSRIVFSMSKSF